MLKKYIAIGYWGKKKNAHHHIVVAHDSLKAVRRDCKANDFIAQIVLTEENFRRIMGLEDNYTRLFEIKKLTSNFKIWNMLTNYLSQCSSDIDNQLTNIK